MARRANSEAIADEGPARFRNPQIGRELDLR
jgi:hypothetical protein